MNAASIFVLTFVVWITAKGKLGSYYALATNSNVGDKEESNVVKTSGQTLPELPDLDKAFSNSSITTV